MPEQPVSNKRPPPSLPSSVAPAWPRYAELHAKTNFSFLEGASHPDELALRAAKLGLAALAVTDRNTLAGVVRAHAAARQLQLKLLIGAEIDLVDAPPVVLWTTDRASYGRLARLITHGRRQAPKGAFRLSFDELAGYAAGLLCGVLPRAPRAAIDSHAHPRREHGTRSMSTRGVSMAPGNFATVQPLALPGDFSRGDERQAV
jgi:error-prone DNA polymerase